MGIALPCSISAITIPPARRSFVRAALVWIVVFHTLHLPLPCPDLDGECRGTLISSLTQSHAWHVLILGVRPNDDIDRGPFRTNHRSDDSAPTGSPFGDPVISSGSGASLTLVVFELGEPELLSHALLSLIDTVRVLRDVESNRNSERSLHARTFCARCSVWLI